MTIRCLEGDVHLTDEMPRPSPRIACYSHDTVGLGHIRRNIAVAAAMINTWPDADAVMITGNPESTSLWLPPRTDVVTLPTVAKDNRGNYRSRTLNASLDSVVAMRSAVIEAAVTSYAPDLLIVDKVPLGVGGELAAMLRRLRTESDTKIILGLREILDDPVSAVAEWAHGGTNLAIEEFYDAVWVYGDQRVYDPIVEYGLPATVARRCVFTGYLAADRFIGTDEPSHSTTLPTEPTAFPTPGPYVLCTVGGGQDGAQLARTFARSTLPAGHDGVVVCGPFMSEAARAAVHAEAAANPRMSVLDFVPDLHRLIADAAAVVSMAGYNSVCEVLATDRPALLVPRTHPRTEQLLRARRLAELGAADLLAADRLTSDRLAAWSAGAVASPATHRVSRANVDLDGLRRLPSIAERLLGRSPRRAELGSTRDRQKVDHRAA
jgi:predicted glycosyltransferase